MKHAVFVNTPLFRPPKFLHKPGCFLTSKSESVVKNMSAFFRGGLTISEERRKRPPPKSDILIPVSPVISEQKQGF